MKAKNIDDQAEGLHQVGLIPRCMVVIYEPPQQPLLTLIADRPGRDSVRIWLLPVVAPWNEDWWEPVERNASF